MKLTYNGVELHALGKLQVLGESVARVPVEQPNRERHVLRARLEFVEPGYADNRAQVAAARSALRVQNGRLVWSDDDGTVFADRLATVLDDDQPEDANAQGTWRQAVVFSFVWETFDVTSNSAGATCQRSGGPLVNLGEVEKCSEQYNAEYFDEMKNVRRRAGGVITLMGVFKGTDGLDLAARRSALNAAKDQMMSELKSGAEVTLAHGSFNKLVRVRSFKADLDQVSPGQNFVRWMLDATYTNYPNESGFLIVDFRKVATEGHEDGVVGFSLDGRIAAESATAARSKLASLRAASGLGSYAAVRQESAERIVESKEGSGGDGQAFVELTFREEYQKHTGNVLRWNLRVATVDDTRSGFVRISYSGFVHAKGASANNAYETARDKAAELGDGKHTLRMVSSVTRNENQVQTSGGIVFVVVEFNYEYIERGERIFLEVEGALESDTFGEKVEQVSGMIAAPTLAAAENFYASAVKTLYAPLLVLRERRTTLSKLEISGAGNVHEGFRFGFAVHKPKAGTETAIAYSVERQMDYVELEKTTTVQGTIFAAGLAEATAALETLVSGLSVEGQLVFESTSEQTRSGPALGQGGSVAAFGGLNFARTWRGALTGVAGVVHCQIVEDISYSGKRWIAKSLPDVDAASVMQEAGLTEATRTVSGTVRAATEAVCLNYVSTARAMISGGYTQPPRLTTTWEFPARVSGVARGEGANFKYCQVSFSFSEVIPDYRFV